jgi:hypothetical protein
MEEWNTIAVKPSKSDAAGDTSRFHLARCIFHRYTLALPDLRKSVSTALNKAIKITSSVKDTHCLHRAMSCRQIKGNLCYVPL